MKSLLVTLTFLSPTMLTPVQAKCKFPDRAIRRLYSTPNLVTKKLRRCIRRAIEDVAQNYNARSFSDSEGDYTYYREGDRHGEVMFSERRFDDDDGRFYYLRHHKSNFSVIYSTKTFNEDHYKYTYFRRGKGDLNVMWSTNHFTDGNERFIYYREKKGDLNTFLSIKVLRDGGGKVVYFRTKRGHGEEICSIRNGEFRNGDRKMITREEFTEIFRSAFWKPLVQKTVSPTLQWITSELSKY